MFALRISIIVFVLLFAGCREESTPTPSPQPAPQGGATTQPAPAQPAATQPAVKVSLRETFAEIDIADHEMSFAWQAPPPGAPNIVYPEDYIWQSRDVTLTDEQLQAIRRWVDDNDIFDLTNPDAHGDPDSYPAAFHHDLRIVIDGREHSISWTDASAWDDMNMGQLVEDAAEALKSLCAGFTPDEEEEQQPMPEGKGGG
jgi:hypothetical protein